MKSYCDAISTTLQTRAKLNVSLCAKQGSHTHTHARAHTDTRAYYSSVSDQISSVNLAELVEGLERSLVVLDTFYFLAPTNLFPLQEVNTNLRLMDLFFLLLATGSFDAH